MEVSTSTIIPKKFSNYLTNQLTVYREADENKDEQDKVVQDAAHHMLGNLSVVIQAKNRVDNPLFFDKVIAAQCCLVNENDPSNPPLWTVRSDDRKIVAYLFGTCHLCFPNTFSFPGKNYLFERIKRSDYVLPELNIGKISTIGKATLYSFKGSFIDAFKDSSSSKKHGKLEVQKNSLMRKHFSKIDEVNKMDTILLYFASAANKPIIPLEKTKDQINIIRGLRDDALNNSAEKHFETDASFIDAYRFGNVKSQERVMQSSLSEASFYTLFTERNKSMANTIIRILSERKGRAFVMVGYGHLVGSGNIRGHLKKAGYTISQVKY